ncbi:hypothetical protein SAMN04488074_12490 [Lentzea albidocapillata subsp. violacea]|uniref:Uncharacterized protein n=1 Tax=Lentzea albidocapillata subsp. violacea TaxID=128104 RepID=A0A1G9UUB2_9PSEU|nr:hypothetical protein SAMN04488074_12490 [Lentzea albidocapillata subsp. violacea]
MAMFGGSIRVARDPFTSEDSCAGQRIHGFRGKYQCLPRRLTLHAVKALGLPQRSVTAPSAVTV